MPYLMPYALFETLKQLGNLFIVWKMHSVNNVEYM